MNITLMDNVFTPINPSDQLSGEWIDVVDYLLYFHDAKTKEQTQMFNLWQFKTLAQGAEKGRHYHDETKQTWDYIPNTIRRCGDNTVGLWGLVLDYDGKKTLEEAIVDMDGIECVVYTTFNHTNEKDKFRVVIPFTRMMPVDEFREKEDDMKACFPHADNASFSLSQAIYLHSGLYPELKFACHLQGNMIDPDMFARMPVKQWTPSPATNTPTYQTNAASPAYKQAVIASLSSCRDVRRGCSKSDQGVLGMAQIAKSVGCSFAEFQQICNHALAADSTVRDGNAQERVWNDATMDRVTKDTRDKFIEKHNGKAIHTCYPQITTPLFTYSKFGETTIRKGITC